MKRTAVHACIALLLLPGCSSSGARNRHTLERGVGAVTTPSRRGAPDRSAADPSFINLRYASLALPPSGASTVDLDVVNRGEQVVPRLRVAVYASPGSVVTANQTLLRSADVSGLSNAGPQHVVIPITAPAKPGSYAIGIALEVPGERPRTSASSRLLVK